MFHAVGLKAMEAMDTQRDVFDQSIADKRDDMAECNEERSEKPDRRGATRHFDTSHIP
jgi:hypothetical protein